MTSSQTFSPLTDPWTELSGFCSPVVLSAPKTWGDPLRSPQMEMPQGLADNVQYVRNNLITSPWRDHLMLLTAVLYSQKLQYKSVLTRLSTLHRGFEDLFPALGIQFMAEWNVDTHLFRYLSSQIVASHTAMQRVRFWTSYQAGSRHLKRWLASLPGEQQELYRPYALPWPSDPQELTLLSNRRQVTEAQQERRKEDTDALMPFYTDLRTQAHLRYNFLLRLRKAYRKAIQAVEQGSATLPLVFELREGGNERKAQQPTECLTFKLWDRRSFVLEHSKENPDLFSRGTMRTARNGERSFAPGKNTYHVEFVSAEALDGTGTACSLWFMELLEQEVLGEISRGPEESAIAKRTWLKEHGYENDEDEAFEPFYTPTPGIILPSKTSGDNEFMRSAREHTGALFIPVESFFVAALFGMVALHILTANGMRIGELQQLRANSECIIPLAIPAPPEAADQSPTVHWAVRAVPKGHRTSTTYYFDNEHLRLLSLIKLMLCEHYGIDLSAGGDLPIVSIRGNNRHRFQPDHYLFQYNSRCLHEGDLRGSIRFLVHGLVFQTLDGRRVTVTPHLLRHGFATWALNVAKEPIDIVAAILNQRNIAVTKYYGRPNPRAIAERSHGLMNQISSYIDIDDLILRSPEELRELLKKAQETHGTLARTRGGRCLLCGECPILFACIGCSAKIPDPAQRSEVEEVQQLTLIQIQRAKKKGLTLEVAQHQKKLKQCDAELREMDMIEACRADELREPEVNFDVEA
jgi:hypothetical protein